MHIEYIHASKFGNGAAVADEFRHQTEAMGVGVDIHHVRELKRQAITPADLYVFSSPGRFGRPIAIMRRFLQRLSLPAGTRYAILTTEAAPRPDRKTGRVPSDEELARTQRVRPTMNKILEAKGLVKVAEDKVFVTGLKGPLEDGWRDKVGAFAQAIQVVAYAS